VATAGPGRGPERAASPACWYWIHGRAPGGPSNPWNPRPGALVSGSPPQDRTDDHRLVTGTRVHPDRPADQGTGQGSVRGRV